MALASLRVVLLQDDKVKCFFPAFFFQKSATAEVFGKRTKNYHGLVRVNMLLSFLLDLL